MTFDEVARSAPIALFNKDRNPYISHINLTTKAKIELLYKITF